MRSLFDCRFLLLLLYTLYTYCVCLHSWLRDLARLYVSFIESNGRALRKHIHTSLDREDNCSFAVVAVLYRLIFHRLLLFIIYQKFGKFLVFFFFK